MKKILLSVTLAFSFFSATSQVLDSENFSTLTIGNIGTDLTGATPGQGSWLTFATGGANTDFQVIDGGATQGNVLQITGSATTTSTKYFWKDGFADIWGFRDAGNDILEVEYDFFSGAPTTSKNSMRVLIYDATGTKVLAGISMAADTKVVSGLAYYNNAGTPGNYLFGLGATAATPIVLTANTWVRMGFSFNLTTGQVNWKGPGFNGFVMGAAAAVAPNEIDTVVATTTGNTASSIGLFDNYIIKAAATVDLLAVNQATATNVFSVYPNPATNVINVQNTGSAGITGVTMTDLNGRVVKQSTFEAVSNTQININDLSSGVYMMKISSNEGSTIKKIIKN